MKRDHPNANVRAYLRALLVAHLVLNFLRDRDVNDGCVHAERTKRCTSMRYAVRAAG